MTVDQEVEKLGYLNRTIPEGLNLSEEIFRLKKEKNAVILAHYYVDAEIQKLADHVGDSLALAQVSKKTDAAMIVFCGVHFMAETAKILNPTKKVILPDLHAGCSLADSAKEEDFRMFKAKYPEAVVVSYINCSAEVKSMSDYICTSSNAVDVVKAIPADREIIFAPDENLGKYVQSVTGRKMHIWEGACIVHVNISVDKLNQLLEKYPEAELIAHPECLSEVLEKANFIGSTKALLDYVQSSRTSTFIVATEVGILFKMREAAPHKKIIAAPAIESNTCACSECPYMKMNTLEKLYNAMYYETPEINLDEKIRIGARRALENMLQLG
ncbi:MAG: quinolinate synthase NadA [Algoriphagus sp.]|nr:quinolinate synthase NadA [Algoriphagus sp.]